MMMIPLNKWKIPSILAVSSKKEDTGQEILMILDLRVQTKLLIMSEKNLEVVQAQFLHQTDNLVSFSLHNRLSSIIDELKISLRLFSFMR